MKKKLLFSLIFLFFFLFFANGNWLSTDIRLDTGDTPGANSSFKPQISNNGNNVYAVWMDDRNTSIKYDVYFNYSTDDGATWQASDIRIDTGDTPGANSSYYPQIGSSGENVYCVWSDDRNGALDIYFNYSTNGGANWQASDIRLDTGDTPGANNSDIPQISSSNSSVYVVWEDNRNSKRDIYFNYSTDGGANWQASDIRIDTGDTPGANNSLEPKISSNGNNVYVVWRDDRNSAYAGWTSDIYFNYSTDGGATWLASSMRINTGVLPGEAFYALGQQISCSSNSVYVVWNDFRNDEHDVYFNHSADGGTTWQVSDTLISTGNLPSRNDATDPQIGSNGSNVYVVWQDERNTSYGGGYDVFFNSSNDGGANWQTADIMLNKGIQPGASWSPDPQISSNGNHAYVAWRDERNGLDDIYFNCSLDGGLTWKTQDVRLDTGDSAGANNSVEPQIASSENAVFVVWRDNRNGSYDIYFNTASIPAPDIKANGSDGPITITQGDPLLITVDFDAGIQSGEDADWWILMKTSDPKPNNWYYFDMPTRTWMLGRFPTRQGSLFDVSSKKVPKTSGLAPGTYTFYFAVDMAMNGSIDVSQAYYDKVKVTINP